MALIVELKNEKQKAFLHVPKTMGMWIRDVIAHNKISASLFIPVWGRKFGFERIMLMASERHHLAVVDRPIEKHNIAIVVRDPVSWYRSFFDFRNQAPKDAWRWSHQRQFDMMVPSEAKCNFDLFIDFVDSTFENGFLYELYQPYLEKAGVKLRDTHLNMDLETFLEQELAFPDPSNVTPGKRTQVSERTAEKIREMEKRYIKEVYEG